MMKRFILILLCVGACMAVIAANPRLDLGASVVPNKLSKINLKKELPDLPLTHLRPIVPIEKNVLTPQELFTTRNCTPNDNQLLKRSSKRLSNDDLLATKVAFLECYLYNDETGEVELSPCYYSGGWEVSMEQIGDGAYYAYLFYNDMIPLTIYADISSGSAEMEMGYLGEFQWSDTTSTGSGIRKTYTVTETTEYLCIVDEAYLFSDGEDFNNLSGMIYDDGSLYFADGFVFYFVDEVTTTVYSYNWTVKSQDNGTYEYMTPIYRDTYLMTPNAVHEYDINGEEHTQNYVYMFQYDDNTAVVWNLWGLDGRGNYMYIHDDGSMTFPVWQPVGTSDISELEEAYPEYDWSEGYEWIVLSYDEENDTFDYSDLEGTVTPDGLSWGTSLLIRYCKLDDSYYALTYEPLYNNQLTFINGDHFVFGYSQEPTITSEVFDDHVAVSANATAQNGVAYLFDANGNWLDNPYIVQRTGEDQSLLFLAVELDEGKNQSEVVTATILIPALTLITGDLDGDGILNLHDVTMLVDLILNGNLDDYSSAVVDAADVNQDGMINDNDVIRLMEMIVNAE